MLFIQNTVDDALITGANSSSRSGGDNSNKTELIIKTATEFMISERFRAAA